VDGPTISANSTKTPITISLSPTSFQAVADGIRLALVIAHPGRNLRFSWRMPMTFKIERLAGKENATVLRTCGRMDIECMNILKALIESESSKTVLDLSEVTLADRDTAMFLEICEHKKCRTQEFSFFSS
jgi:hypothetical protein